MKTTPKRKKTNSLRKEYDFKKISSGIRGKYAKEFHKGTNLVLLEPDVAKVFPTSEEVNNVLKLLIKVASKQ